jgi:hypothetical protein
MCLNAMSQLDCLALLSRFAITAHQDVTSLTDVTLSLVHD